MQPSQIGGLNTGQMELPYHGVFLADHGGGSNTFDFDQGATDCLMQRTDNTEPQWHKVASSSTIPQRLELIRKETNPDLNVDLGPDLLLCDATSIVLGPTDTSPGKSYRWNTGETGSTITVATSGRYAVEVKEGCSVGTDSVSVAFRTSPPVFSLGEDETSCLPEPRILTVDFDASPFTFTWQDGSTGTSFTAKEFGTYWLKVENECGVEVDSIAFIGRNLQIFRHSTLFLPIPATNTISTSLLTKDCSGVSYLYSIGGVKEFMSRTTIRTTGTRMD